MRLQDVIIIVFAGSTNKILSLHAVRLLFVSMFATQRIYFLQFISSMCARVCEVYEIFAEQK